MLRIPRLKDIADEANEVQENVVTAKNGKKRGIKAITSFQVNNPYTVTYPTRARGIIVEYTGIETAVD